MKQSQALRPNAPEGDDNLTAQAFQRAFDATGLEAIRKLAEQLEVDLHELDRQKSERLDRYERELRELSTQLKKG